MTFAPADIDMESGFDLVAEWQDYRETANIRLQDFTMDKLFEWMERYNYRFEETSAIKLVSLLGRFSSYFSDSAKEMLSSVFPRVPINMPRKTVAVVAMLHKTAEPIYHELQRLNQDIGRRDRRADARARRSGGAGKDPRAGRQPYRLSGAAIGLSGKAG